GERVDRGGPPGRAGAAVDQDHQGDLGQLVTGDGLGFGKPEGTEFGDRENRGDLRRPAATHIHPQRVDCGPSLWEADRTLAPRPHTTAPRSSARCSEYR